MIRYGAPRTADNRAGLPEAQRDRAVIGHVHWVGGMDWPGHDPAVFESVTRGIDKTFCQISSHFCQVFWIHFKLLEKVRTSAQLQRRGASFVSL